MTQFLISNILLIIIALVCAVSLAWPLIMRRRWGPELDNASATDLINHKNAQIVDLRVASEFRKESIAGSINIPAVDLGRQVNKLDKKRPVLLVDDNGQLARSASPLLRGLGYQVCILQGGLDAWRAQQIPLQR